MAGPFYNAIKGTTAGAPGTGAFTPNAASAGYSAWSTVPSGWMGLARFEDGAAWELRYCYWNGSSISRPSNIVASSSGSALTLTSAATASLVIDGSEVQPHFGSTSIRGNFPNAGLATWTSIGMSPVTSTGTVAAAAIAGTNYLTEQPRVQYTSVATANGQTGISFPVTNIVMTSSVAGRGGWEFVHRFGASAIPATSRVFVGMTSGSYVASTGNPGAHSSFMAILGKDSTDTNLQFICNDLSTAAKIDTGIPWVANAFYEVTIWSNPGSLTVFMLLMRLDTGAIYYGSTTTKVPTTGSTLMPQSLFALSAAATAYVAHLGQLTLRTGG